MIAPLKKVSCPLWSYRGAVLSCANLIPKYLFLGVIYWPSDYDHISLHQRFDCTDVNVNCYLYIYYLDSYLQIYRDGILWSNLALTGGNSRHRKRLRKKRCEVDLPWRVLNYDDVGSICDFNCFCDDLYWLSMVVLRLFVIVFSFKLLKPWRRVH